MRAAPATGRSEASVDRKERQGWGVWSSVSPWLPHAPHPQQACPPTSAAWLRRPGTRPRCAGRWTAADKVGAPSQHNSGREERTPRACLPPTSGRTASPASPRCAAAGGGGRRARQAPAAGALPALCCSVATPDTARSGRARKRADDIRAWRAVGTLLRRATWQWSPHVAHPSPQVCTSLPHSSASQCQHTCEWGSTRSLLTASPEGQAAGDGPGRRLRAGRPRSGRAPQ